MHIVFNAGSLAQFFEQVTPVEALELFSREYITAAFVPSFVGAHTRSEGGSTIYDVGQVYHAKKADGRKLSKNDHLIESICSKSGLTRSARRTELLRRKIKMAEFPSGPNSISEMTRGALTNPQFYNDLPSLILPQKYEGIVLPKQYRFKVEHSPRGLLVDTDINFEELSNQLRKLRSDPECKISPANILAAVIEAQSHAYFASCELGELVTSPIHSSLFQKQISSLLQKRNKSEEEISSFQDFVFDNARSIRSAVNSGALRIDEFLQLLDGADKFRHWLQTDENDLSLVKRYHRALEEKSFLQRMPARTMKFVVFGAAGLFLNPVVGLGLAAADFFFLEKLSQGWKPNQFVKRRLIPAVGSD